MSKVGEMWFLVKWKFRQFSSKLVRRCSLAYWFLSYFSHSWHQQLIPHKPIHTSYILPSLLPTFSSIPSIHVPLYLPKPLETLRLHTLVFTFPSFPHPYNTTPLFPSTLTLSHLIHSHPTIQTLHNSNQTSVTFLFQSSPFFSLLYSTLRMFILIDSILKQTLSTHNKVHGPLHL